MAKRSVRLKIDPRDSLQQDFVNCQGYEGWVLEEDPGSGDMSVFVADLGDLLSIPAKATEYDGETLDIFKSYIKDVLIAADKAEPDAPELDKITSAKNCNEIEDTLRMFDYSESELVDLYRNFIEVRF